MELQLQLKAITQSGKSRAVIQTDEKPADRTATFKQK